MVNMKNHFSIALTCLLAACLLYGCASTQETSTMQQSISMLHERQLNLERRFESVDAQAQRGGDLYARMDELQVRIGALNGRIEELEHRINQVARAQAQHPPAPAQPSSESAPPPASPPVSAPAPQAATTAPPPPPPLPVEKENPEKVQYDKAMQSFQQASSIMHERNFSNSCRNTRNLNLPITPCLRSGNAITRKRSIRMPSKHTSRSWIDTLGATGFLMHCSSRDPHSRPWATILQHGFSSRE